MADVTRRPREVAVTFGTDRGLVGVLTLPVGERNPAAPHVILINSGVIHRVGSNRLHVLLARALSGLGVTTFRFDLAGIGDSERPAEALSLRDSVERDIADACAYLASTQKAERFVMIGLCSGAHDALCSALREPRAVGAVLLDIPGPFQGWRHMAYDLAARVSRRNSWRRRWQGLVRYLRILKELPRMAAMQAHEEYTTGARQSGTRQRMRGQLDMLLARGVKLFFIFTPGMNHNYNHRSQFQNTFPQVAAHPLVAYDYLANADHLFSTRAMRAQVVDIIVRWVERGLLSAS